MVISDGTDTNRYPDVLAETDENELQGYFGFQYNEETGYLSGGKFQSFGAMYFRGKPNPLTVAPPVHSDDNDPIHGLGYPDLPPGQYPIDWLPYDEDTEGNKTYYFTLSFEEMELEFTIARETDANGVVTDKHKIIYRNRIKEKKAA
jgi:hypothetical protein